ncbi:MAG: hypothetical protein HS113_02930 [Verrucomicrobiales bacterium]|nr:hypothetical protein [Verrucomicrobiales bacterium]
MDESPGTPDYGTMPRPDVMGGIQITRGCPLNCHFGSVNLSYRRNLHLDCQAYADFRRQRPDGTKPFTKKDEDQYE